MAIKRLTAAVPARVAARGTSVAAYPGCLLVHDWPRTAAGRLLCVLLALYSFAIFGYVTATIASFFVDRDAADQRAPLAGQQAIESLRAEIAGMRGQIQALREEPRRG